MKSKATAVCVLLLTALVLFPVAAWSREVMVEVISIAASMQPESQSTSSDVQLDPRLASFSKNLRSLFAYQKYTFIDKKRLAVEPGSAVPFRLPEHFSLEVAPDRPEPGAADMIQMTITLYRDTPQRALRGGERPLEREVVLRTKIRLKNGGTVLLGGPPIRTGVLLMALSARG
jgi:hypothetical protein